jgi:hypothetical protein
MSKPDPFDDLKALREAGESVVESPRPKRPAAGSQPKRRKQGFIILSADWRAAIYRARPPISGATRLVADRLIELFRFKKSQTVVLGNSVLESWGVGRRAKYRGLKELEVLGLIAVEYGRGQAPRVTWLVDPDG